MSNIPSDCRYTKEHEWAKNEGELITIGITDYAQSSLGDIVFVELPEVGRELSGHETFGVIESVKSVSDLYAPIAGEVVQINEDLEASPESCNEAPYDSWLIKIKPQSADDFTSLLDASQYESLIQSLD